MDGTINAQHLRFSASMCSPLSYVCTCTCAHTCPRVHAHSPLHREGAVPGDSGPGDELECAHLGPQDPAVLLVCGHRRPASKAWKTLHTAHACVVSGSRAPPFCLSVQEAMAQLLPSFTLGTAEASGLSPGELTQASDSPVALLLSSLSSRTAQCHLYISLL